MYRYRHLSGLITAIRNCEKLGNTEWLDKHATRLHELGTNQAPSGSGLDAGSELVLKESTPDKLVFSSTHRKGSESVPTYDEKREKVMQSELDVFAAREVAFAWYGGQDSALYSFASTDCTVWSEKHRASLLAEIDRAILLAMAKPSDYYPDWQSVDTYTREKFQSGTPEKDWGSPQEAGLESLDNLRLVVLALPAKG